MVAANSYRGIVSSLDADGFVVLCKAVDERKCHSLIGFETLGEAVELW